jgi:urease accessory protein
MNAAVEVMLLLADGRWPGGGYAHSGGLEAAVANGSVHDPASLEQYVSGRLFAGGPFEAWVAARACDGVDPTALGEQYDARTPSPAQRKASKSLGRGLLRSSARIWPELKTLTVSHQAVAVGVVARAAGLAPLDAARLSVHAFVMSPLTAAPKLFAIDTADALRIAVALADSIDAIARDATCSVAPPPRSSFVAEFLAEEHSNWTTRLFAS